MVHEYAYDSAGRLAADAVTDLGDSGQDVDGAGRRIEWAYDELGRTSLVTSFDDPELAGNAHITSQTAYAYDSWGDVATAWQSHGGAAVTTGENESPHVHYAYDDGSPSGGEAPHLRLSSVTYPDGRVVYYNYGAAAGTDDVLSLLADIADGTGTNRVKYAAYTYLGAGTVVQVDHPALDSVGGLRLTYKGATDGVYSGFDRFGRVVDQKWQDDSTTPVIKDRFEYTYDRNSNRLTRSNDLNTDLSEAYSYDGLDRLVGADRDGANLQDWGLDSLGNWGTFTEGSTTQDRTHNAANEIQTADGWVSPTFDDAGNMVSGPKPGSETARQHYRYDAWNRLVKVTDDCETPVTIAEYRYDGQGRRTAKIVRKVAGETVTYDRTDYEYNESWQVLEERTATYTSLTGTGGARTTPADTPAVQYLWDGDLPASGGYSDAPVLRWRDADADPETGQSGLEETLYYCQDANFNTTALIDAATGEVAEHYYYDPYGKAHVCDDSWTEISWSNSLQNTVLYGGYGLDSESGLYHTDAREYDCSLGRFIQTDPIGLAAGPNVYAYCDGWPTGA